MIEVGLEFKQRFGNLKFMVQLDSYKGDSQYYCLFHANIELIAIIALSFLLEFVIDAYQSEVKQHGLV